MRIASAVVAVSLALFVPVVAPVVARADLPPPNVAPCNGKSVGDTCTTDDGKAGACQSSTCSKLDYSHGTPPSSVSYPCVQCTAGAAPSGSTSASNSASTPTEGGSGCSLGVTARSVGPWALAAIVPAIVFFARRRRGTRRRDR
jgi:hypothetical protein